MIPFCTENCESDCRNRYQAKDEQGNPIRVYGRPEDLSHNLTEIYSIPRGLLVQRNFYGDDPRGVDFDRVISQQLGEKLHCGSPSRSCWRCGKTTSNQDNLHLGHRNQATSEGGNLEDVNVCLEGAACNLSAGNRGGPKPGMSCAERGSCGAPYGRSD